jgi:phenylalanyl-tRNA synthetase beta chain
MLFELELEPVLRRVLPAFQPIARHQVVERDIAVVVAESVAYAALKQTIAASLAPGLLRDAVLFDVYRPKPAKGGEPSAAALSAGEKSLAIRLVLGGDATLSEAQIDAAVQAVVGQLAVRHGARLRA